MLPFIIAGLVSGAVYGMAGVGLVLTYKTSGILNFAHGALATVAAYSFYFLHVQHGVAWPLAALIVLVFVGPVISQLLAGLAKRLTYASLALQVASTVGVLLIVQSTFSIVYGTSTPRSVPSFLPTHLVRIFGTSVSVEKIIVFGVSTLMTVLLYLYFRQSRSGTAMRAIVEDPDLLDLSGTKPNHVRRWAWLIGVEFATLSGLLLASFVPLTGTTLTFLVVQAFGAAALGAFTSLPITFLGGLAIGVVGSIATKYFTSGVLAQLPASLPFIILFLVILFFPRSRLQERIRAKPVISQDWRTPGPVQVVSGLLLLIFLVTVPSWVGYHLGDWTLALTSTMLFLSLGLLVRTSGQVSLCHITFSAVGAAAFSHLAVDHHWPWLVAILAAGLIAVPVGALIAIPAIRLGGLYLALATLGFGIGASQMFYSSSWMFGSLGLGLSMPRPSWLDLGSDKNFYYLCLLITMLTALLVSVLNRSRLGRLLRGLADSPVALATNGAAVSVTRVLVFCLSAFIAAVAGALAGVAQTTVSGESYQPIISLSYLTLIVIVAGGAPWYALAAGFGLSLVPSYITASNTSFYLQLLFGLSAIALALTPDSKRGAPAWVRKALDGAFGRTAAQISELPWASPASQTSHRAEPITLRGDDLRVQFGGLIAVNGVNLAASSGRITGLIGPNGAGKTTTFNVLNGLNRPTRGRVFIDGQDVTRSSVAGRARQGLGRTFQQMELFESLTVRENVALGAEARRAGVNPLHHVIGRRGEKAAVELAADRAMRLVGVEDLAARRVAGLSTGRRRLVELARCVAGDYRMLLLDEPSSGLDRAETAAFGEILKAIVRERGVGILLVEHDMALVNDVCDDIYVLDFGELLYEGTPSEVMASEVVRAAYLGTDVTNSPKTAPHEALS